MLFSSSSSKAAIISGSTKRNLSSISFAVVANFNLAGTDSMSVSFNSDVVDSSGGCICDLSSVVYSMDANSIPTN